jgi:hypothetical protein
VQKNDSRYQSNSGQVYKKKVRILQGLGLPVVVFFLLAELGSQGEIDTDVT